MLLNSDSLFLFSLKSSESDERRERRKAAQSKQFIVKAKIYEGITARGLLLSVFGPQSPVLPLTVYMCVCSGDTRSVSCLHPPRLRESVDGPRDGTSVLGVRENGALVHTMISMWLFVMTKKGLWWQGMKRKQGTRGNRRL